MIEVEALSKNLIVLFSHIIETLIIRFAILIIGPIVKMVINSCFIEIYLYTSIAPIPFLTMTNRK